MVSKSFTENNEIMKRALFIFCDTINIKLPYTTQCSILSLLLSDNHKQALDRNKNYHVDTDL